MFNPMQSQAALQNPARFPDQKLQQYAAGKPPQPSGQVTSDMAQQELASRGQERQAAQRQQAMQNNPKNSPTIYQQLMMKEQAIQQKEQQLGMASEMMNRKAQELAERERGIGALAMRPDMFTAMDGGIVFSGGGGVEGYAQRGLVQPDDSSSVDVPSTTGEPDPAAAMDVVRELLASRKRVAEAGQKAILSEEDQAKRRKERIDEMAAEFAEYEKGRSGREERMAQALRGKDPEVLDFLMAMAAGGPGKTLAETLSRMVPGAAKLRTEQQARQMAAAKYLAEAEEKAAQAQLAEKRGQRAAADKFLQDEQALRLKGFEILKGAEDTGIRALASVQEAQDRQASEAARRKEAAERQALELRKYEEAPSRDEAKLRLEADLKSALIREEAKARRENREPEFREKLFNIANDSKDPRNEMARELLSERRGAGADGRPTFDQITNNVEKRMQSTDINKIIKAAAKDPKNPRTLTESDIREMFFDEEIARAKRYYGEDVFKGMGKSSKPSSAGAVDMSNPLLSGKL